MAHVLIADDEVAYLSVFCEGMEALGHTATGVTNGTQLLELVRTGGFDIVFLDVVMDGGGAITLTHQVRAIDHDLPIVIITGRPELIDSPLLRAGLRTAVAKLPKTVSLAQLGKVIRTYARPSQAGDLGHL